jgi:probable F420-dependent oxidoreductase
MTRPFRFGVNLLATESAPALLGAARRAEDLGYDVVNVPDHLGMPSPLPTLVAAAGVTQRVRLGTFVLNTAFYRPAVLARDVAATDQLVGGRLELGLGTGYVKEEFDAAGVDYGTAGSRLDHLAATVDDLRARLADPEHRPVPVQRPVPLLLGGHGPRTLRLAGRVADTVGFTGATSDGVGNLALVDADALDQRVGVAVEAAGTAGRDPELNVLVQQVRIADTPREQVAAGLHEHVPYLSAGQLAEVPTLLFGTVDAVAEAVRGHRTRFGFSSWTVLEPFMEAFAPVMARLRELEAPGG